MTRQHIVIDMDILMDLMGRGLLGLELSGLPLETHTAALVLNECTDVKQRELIDEYVSKNVLKVRRYSAEDLERLVMFRLRLRQASILSLADCSVWMLARELGCPLLTGDKKLREVAGANIETCAYICLLEQLKEHESLRDAATERPTSFANKSKCHDWKITHPGR